MFRAIPTTRGQMLCATAAHAGDSDCHGRFRARRQRCGHPRGLMLAGDSSSFRRMTEAPLERRGVCGGPEAVPHGICGKIDVHVPLERTTFEPIENLHGRLIERERYLMAVPQMPTRCRRRLRNRPWAAGYFLRLISNHPEAKAATITAAARSASTRITSNGIPK